MYNEISSFKKYLSTVIKPILGCNLYFGINSKITFPCVVASVLNIESSDIQTATEILFQFDVLANNSDEKTALNILDKLFNALKVNNNQQGDSCYIWDYTDVNNPVNTNKKIIWIDKSSVRIITDVNNPEIIRYGFDITLIF